MTDNQDSAPVGSVQGGWITHDGSPMPALSGRVEVKLRSGDCFTGSDLSDDKTWLHIWGEGDIVAYRLARPATSAASEGEGVRERIIAAMSVELEKHGCFVGDAVSALVWSSRLYDASPASERERELEGALREAKRFIKDNFTMGVLGGRTVAGQAVDAIDRALTAQPAGEGK